MKIIYSIYTKIFLFLHTINTISVYNRLKNYKETLKGGKNLIEVKNLVKDYGAVRALRGVSFTLERGHVYGLLGPNGAGKSTTMNIITGCLAATSGDAVINGHDVYSDAAAAKREIGYLPEIPPLYPEMTPKEYLTFVAKAKKIKGAAAEAERVAALCGVTDVEGRLIRHLSKGYRQRVGIAAALVGDPENVILDEPTVGLDPKQIIEIRRLITSLKKDHTVVLSSHIMGEITAVCDHIIIIAEGEVVASGTVEELEGLREGVTLTVESSGDAEDVQNALSGITGVTDVRCYPKGANTLASVATERGADARGAVFDAYVAAGLKIYGMTSSAHNLEDLFLRLTEEAAARRAEGDAGSPADAEKQGEEYKPVFSDEGGEDE